MSLKIYFLRHGQSTHSKLELYCGSRTDAVLTPEGHEMAKRFAALYSSTPFEAIYCSPQTRARETAQPLAEAIGKEPIIRPHLQEIDYGAWEGLSLAEVTASYAEDHARWIDDPVVYAPPGGETAEQVQARVIAAISEIQEAHPSGNVLVVSHKSTIRIAISTLLGVDLKRYRSRIGCPVCSVSIVEFTARGPLLHILGERRHLDERLITLQGS